jgi:beta-glucosidase-like glycosyl hydrolase
MNDKEKIAQLVIARLDGGEINKRYRNYESLVKRGIGGFIVFGGRAKDLSGKIKRLQKSADVPLFIGSDLEQGLGQQIEGGTVFPPAMAVSQAVNTDSRGDVSLLKKAVGIIAGEARAAGINVIFSPVLDINTNPDNPIICTRAFSDKPGRVAWFGNEFIKGFQREGIIACAKHFPGHGDTAVDSHRELPVIHADMKRLSSTELYPFARAVKAGVKMIMVGHLKVPVLDPGLPSSLSQRVIQGMLRQEMGFKGLVITDAMNMHGVRGGGRGSEEEACLHALNAGADILLHPGDPDRVIDYLLSRKGEIMEAVERSFKRVIRAKRRLATATLKTLAVKRIGLKSSLETAQELARKSVRMIPPSPRLLKRSGDLLKNTVVLVIDDDNSRSGDVFVRSIRNSYPGAGFIYIDNSYRGSVKGILGRVSDRTLITAVFSKVSAWKGRSGLSTRLSDILSKVLSSSRHSIIAGFCCPYVLRSFRADVVIKAYSGEGFSQEAAADMICSTRKSRLPASIPPAVGEQDDVDVFCTPFLQ